MNRKLFSILTAMMWLALPLTALRYWQVWNELPARMATHFGANGEPNGWMSRQVAFYFALGVTGFTLVTFTAVAYAMQKQKPPDSSSVALLGFFYLVLVFIFYVNNSVLAHNLTGRPVAIAPVLVGLPFAVIVFMVVYLRLQRGPALATGPILAEEAHGSRTWAVVFLLFTLLEFGIFAAIPSIGVRVGMALMCLLFLLIAVHAWTGFEYRFTPFGIEISTLGFRLRSIPLAQIRDYRIESWSPLRGYGIRGVGNTRAYVWGNRVVHITTQDGEVFLGHNDPAQIMRDLDQMKQFTHS
jgi:hypothetical protein